MERSSLLRWLLLGAAVLLFFTYGLPALTGKGSGPDRQQLAGVVENVAPPPDQRRPAETCTIDGVRFRAELSSKGATLAHHYLTDPKYRVTDDGERPIDLVTVPIQERAYSGLAGSSEPRTTLGSEWGTLRTNLRAPSGTDQIAWDDVDWTLAASTPQSCTFTYEDEQVSLEKVVSATERPFELRVALKVENRAAEAKTHRLTVETTDWRTVKETEGSWGRVSEFLTQAVVHSNETHRWAPSDFEPSDFSDEGFTNELWRRAPGGADWVAVSSSYFAKALVPVQGPFVPSGEALIEEIYDPRVGDKKDDPNYGHIYRARLNYAEKQLAPGESVSYEVVAFAGPKERDVLAGIAGGGHDTTEMLELGFFGAIGKLLIRYLYVLNDLVGAWGWAIVLLTITVRLLLFPLSIAQIKSTIAMRKLKPQMDEINAKYKDDPQQRGLALQELWRKNKVANPMLGCLPVLLQMPVWWALYQSLQTAVELYHTPFGPLIPDLAARDPYFIIPIVLGASSFLQQHLMPMQGDPMQQKMMKYMMPAIFTVMMLFLPAGLGIYFLTNTWLGIVQQLAMERYYKSQEEGGTPEPTATADEGKEKAFGKGKTRVQQRG